MQPNPLFREIGSNDPMVVAIAALVRAEFERQAETGFAMLTRLPSSGIIKLLDYLATLSEVERKNFFDAEARLAALHFFPSPRIAATHERLRTSDPAILRFAEAMRSRAFAEGLRYAGLRMGKAMLTDPESMAQMIRTRLTLDFAPRDDPPEALVGGADLREVEVARAPQLRKLLDPMLRARLATKPEKRPGGEIVYQGAIGGAPVKVKIVFSNRYAQMIYGVGWALRERDLSTQRLSYETLWGMNTGWDYLTEENAARSIELLDELLLSLADLLRRVADLPRGA